MTLDSKILEWYAWPNISSPCRRKSRKKPIAVKYRIRSLAMNRDRTRTESRAWRTCIDWTSKKRTMVMKFHRRTRHRTRPETSPSVLGCEAPPRTHCRVRPPVDSSVETKPCDASSPRTEDQNHLHQLLHHTSVWHTVTPDCRSMVEEVSHWATRCRRERSVGDLKRKIDSLTPLNPKSRPLPLPPSCDSLLLQERREIFLWPHKSPESPRQTRTTRISS